MTHSKVERLTKAQRSHLPPDHGFLHESLVFATRRTRCRILTTQSLIAFRDPPPRSNSCSKDSSNDVFNSSGCAAGDVLRRGLLKSCQLWWKIGSDEERISCCRIPGSGCIAAKSSCNNEPPRITGAFATHSDMGYSYPHHGIHPVSEALETISSKRMRRHMFIVCSRRQYSWLIIFVGTGDDCGRRLPDSYLVAAPIPSSAPVCCPPASVEQPA